jgi:hypothetical protein
VIRGVAVRLWREDRAALAVLALGSLLTTIAWRAAPRPMGDTWGYREDSVVFTTGWGSLTRRTPGYPLLMWATGAQDGPTRLLFVVQLLLHAASVLLVVDLARRFGVGRRGRAVLALLLVAPPVMMRVLYEGSEALAAFLLTLVAWLVLVPGADRRPVARGVALGLTCAAATMVRPTFSLVWIPVGLVAAWPHGRRLGLRVAGAVALPAVVVLVGYSALNGIRFDSWGPTPLAAYNLSSRTSAYVEDLPDRYEPARSVLVAERDSALLEGEETAPSNFVFAAYPELEQSTGKHGPELDRYVMEMDVWLIVHHPFDYVDAVLRSWVTYVPIDSQDAVRDWGRGPAWIMAAVHLGLVALLVGVALLVPGLVMAGRAAARRAGRALLVCGVLSLYVGAVSTMFEAGSARMRAPTEPLLALALVLGVSVLRRSAPFGDGHGRSGSTAERSPTSVAAPAPAGEPVASGASA